MIASDTQRIHARDSGARPAPTGTSGASATAAADGATRSEKRAKKSSASFAAAPSISRDPICASLPPTCACTA